MSQSADFGLYFVKQIFPILWSHGKPYRLNSLNVGIMKFGTDAYIIIDNNHNQKMDAQDIIFSFSNKDIPDISDNPHDQTPIVVVNGSSQLAANFV
ncbi:hypothetical protein ACUTQ5_09970 [Serratia sp. NA_112.1]|uniref:hypothetical protein n=1 Tax=unclassified Serratia (in: enterobacteria) TaxID=2647522 RepID=UPI0040468F8E